MTQLTFRGHTELSSNPEDLIIKFSSKGRNTFKFPKWWGNSKGRVQYTKCSAFLLLGRERYKLVYDYSPDIYVSAVWNAGRSRIDWKKHKNVTHAALLNGDNKIVITYEFLPDGTVKTTYNKPNGGLPDTCCPLNLLPFLGSGDPSTDCVCLDGHPIYLPGLPQLPD